jgi:hypothetical protein
MKDMIHKTYNDKMSERDVKHHTFDKKLSTPEDSVYVSDDGKRVIYTQRGSHTKDDWIFDDARLVVDELARVGSEHTGLPLESLSSFLPDRPRRDKAELIYKMIKVKYPNAKIHLGGHSLAGSLSKHILYKNPHDDIIGYGFNSATHSKHDKVQDTRYYPYRTISHDGRSGDIVSSTADAFHPNTRLMKTAQKENETPVSLHGMGNFPKKLPKHRK